jgi:hypothetical protein
MVESRNLREINNLRGQGMIDLERQQFFWSRTKKEGDHLIWTGSYSSRNYGFMYFGRGEKVYASRVSYCIARNLDLKDIEHLIILKTCDRNDCVSNDHLVAKTKKIK